MTLLLGVIKPLDGLNQRLLKAGWWLAILSLTFMVLFILVQIFYRYALNNALPWPEEGARFLMVWMTGLAAPLAFRQGGFVAIDMAANHLPPKLVAALSLLLLMMSLLILVIAVHIGWSEVTGFSGRFKTASLYLPTAFDLSSYFRIPRSWMMASLLYGFSVMVLVNIELILRQIVVILGKGDDLPPIARTEDVSGAD